MELEITLPDEVPVMTLPEAALFPQALMPLHIFEPRYRHMLRDVLASNRLLAVAGLDRGRLGESGNPEPPYRIATVGMVRACQKNGNGTSNLLLQGLTRVEILAITRDEPYRSVRVRALVSEGGADAARNQELRRRLARLIGIKLRLQTGAVDEIATFLKTVEDPETFSDIAAFSLCEDSGLKQRLLETLDVGRRLELLADQLLTDIEELKLKRRLQGRLPDDHISLN
ncbi:MAG: LON peptidase substrate-binding domain-containing protein [Verrucomicrobia bacterium]|nr:LON peptidase substrate-binding domain-containing protein [Verrucomicrobiota bacterium]